MKASSTAAPRQAVSTPPHSFRITPHRELLKGQIVSFKLLKIKEIGTSQEAIENKG
jgi:hypothetical protein